MLKKIDELGKLSSKNRSQESDQHQFPKLPQLACAKSFGYLAMIEDPNIAGGRGGCTRCESFSKRTRASYFVVS